MGRKLSFPPVAKRDARILVLGTLPGELSLQKNEYYAHPRNLFWRIVSSIFDISPTDPYPDRCAGLICNGVALWDVLREARRKGSLDTNIKDEIPNDFRAFFDINPEIKSIIFNGVKAHSLYMRHVVRGQGLNPCAVRMMVMPSTSPANTMSFERKAATWRAALLAL